MRLPAASPVQEGVVQGALDDSFNFGNCVQVAKEPVSCDCPDSFGAWRVGSEESLCRTFEHLPP